MGCFLAELGGAGRLDTFGCLAFGTVAALALLLAIPLAGFEKSSAAELFALEMRFECVVCWRFGGLDC
jgi:hypothetical protein